MKLLIILLLSISLQAKIIWVVETTDLIGKCTIEVGDVIIKPEGLKLIVPRGINVVECTNLKCVESEINRYKHLYRTNGIGVEFIR